MEMSENEKETIDKIKKLQEEARELKKTIPKRHKAQPLPKSIKDEEL